MIIFMLAIYGLHSFGSIYTFHNEFKNKNTPEKVGGFIALLLKIIAYVILLSYFVKLK